MSRSGNVAPARRSGRPPDLPGTPSPASERSGPPPAPPHRGPQAARRSPAPKPRREGRARAPRTPGRRWGSARSSPDRPGLPPRWRLTASGEPAHARVRKGRRPPRRGEGHRAERRGSAVEAGGGGPPPPDFRPFERSATDPHATFRGGGEAPPRPGGGVSRARFRTGSRRARCLRRGRDSRRPRGCRAWSSGQNPPPR